MKGQRNAKTSRHKRRRRESGELRNAILKAAAEVFFDNGYKGASIEAVIERVGGSRRTIYSYFGGKKELFAALVFDTSQRAVAALAPERIDARDLESTLITFGKNLTKIIMSPTTASLYRVVVAEGLRFPEVAEIFFDAGPGLASKRLAAVLERFQKLGEIKIDEPQRAAEHFIGMLRDDSHLRVVLGLHAPSNDREIEASVQQAVKLFLRGCSTR